MCLEMAEPQQRKTVRSVEFWFLGVRTYVKLDDDVALKNTIDGDCPAFPALSVDADTLDYAPFCTDTWRQNGEHPARVAKLHAEAPATGSIREKEPWKGGRLLMLCRAFSTQILLSLGKIQINLVFRSLIRNFDQRRNYSRSEKYK